MIKEANLRVDDLKIVGQLYLPDQGKVPFPGVILCHGVPSGSVDPNDGGYPLLAKTISERGFGRLYLSFSRLWRERRQFRYFGLAT